MEWETVMYYFNQYGAIAIFAIVLMEYLNLPGFPAGVIMPLAGLFAAQGKLGFFHAIAITVLAGMTGSILLYALGRYGGGVLLEKYYKHFPSHREIVEKKISYLREKGCMGIFISKLIPMVRTLIPIPAGLMKMNFRLYCISTALGVTVWNFLFVGAGYFLGEQLIGMLMLP